MEMLGGGNLNIFLQLFVALVLGGLLGLERTWAGKMAGMRTYALVSMASALFVIISRIVSERHMGLTNFDPLRMASQIIVGIGFLGAGLIIFRERKITGLTTAAGLWMAAGIGISVGFGLYAIGVFAAVMTVLVFSAFWYIEKKIKRWMS